MEHSLPWPRRLSTPALSRARLGDWCGFLLFLGLALNTLRTPGGIGIALLPSIALECVVALSFLIRERPRQALRTPMARLAAYVGSFVLVVFIPVGSALAPHWFAVTRIYWMTHAGAIIWLAGTLFSLGALWSLRRSFSIEPAARRLVTTGLYRFARHPVYAGYAMTNTGMLLLYPSAPLAMAIAVWFGATLIRMRYEEQVLVQAFPTEYAAYRLRVAALGPRLSTFLGRSRA